MSSRSHSLADHVREPDAQIIRVRAALLGGVVGAAFVAATFLITAGGSEWDARQWVLVAASAIAGAVAVLLGERLAAPLSERLFGRTTRVRLLELSSPSHPLLLRLMTDAPGTYSHSMLAANLAETAASAIGADPLLARVGAYYHDIGKIRRPVYFAENQAGESNPHDTESPSASAHIITAHVREGVDLAREYHLPPSVIEIIREHHGDSLVACFYTKASVDAPVAEDDFRYDAECPHSREAALVMLADSSEAAARCIRESTVSTVESTVRRVIEAKLTDGQLVESGLGGGDLETVARVYSRMLASIYHPRVAYPECAPRRGMHAGQHHQSSRT